MIDRDEFGQPVGEWSDFQLDLLAILEDVATPDRDGGNPEKSLMAYVADIQDLFTEQESTAP